MKRFLATPVALLLTLAVPAQALDLFESAKPQSTGHTCQSYAPILALAALSDPAFEISTFAELRQLETDFRSILTSISGGNTTTHTFWPKTMEQLTGGQYTIDLKYESDLVKYLGEMRDQTALSSDLGSLIGQLSGVPFATVMTSVFAFDGSAYKKGHIITVMGVKGSGVNSDTQLIAFNSAIKGQGGSVNQCAPGDQPGDHSYKAGVVASNSFIPKAFDSLGYLIMTVKRK